MDTYEKKYKEALGWMQSLYNGLHGKTKEEAERYFPELKESEDERIRKLLISGMKNLNYSAETFASIPIKDVIDWLEKQGKIDNIPLEGSTNTVTTDSRKNQVEPIFKVGDWITNGRYARLIVGINSDWPYYMFKDGTSKRIKDIDKKYRLWTIEDAKDGDALINKSNNRECPFIFKETKPSDIKTDILNPLAVLGYCGIGGAGFTKGSGWGDTANCIYYPATKEQRDLLFQKMKEAGYEWDSEKKELKKISQRMVSAEAKEAMYDKPAWSEEDERTIHNIDAAIRHEVVFPIDELKSMRIWLESLKYRIRPKHEWKRDEKMFQLIEDAIDVYRKTQGSVIGGVHTEELKDYLKSLKQRYTWKPSDE